MASSLRVNAIIPSNGINVAIGTAGGTITYNATVSGVSTFSNGIVVSAGTTSSPSISPSEDSNTGIFFPAPDTVAIGEGGIETLRINSSGYIGINTTNPQKLIEVGAANTTSKFQLHPHGAGWDLGATSGNIAPHYQSNISLYSGQIASGTLRWRIDSDGYMTVPYQPAFMVRGDGSGSISGGSKFTFTKVVSVGMNAQVIFARPDSCWSDADDRFTAPVAGVYCFTFGIYRQSATSSTIPVAPRINGNQLSIGDTFIFFTSATGETGNTDDGMYGSFLMNLAANDYVELFLRSSYGPVTWYGQHSFFGGYLVG